MVVFGAMVVFGGVVVVGRLEPVRGGAGIFRGLDRRRLDIVVVADVIRRLGLERGLLGQQRPAVGDGGDRRGVVEGKSVYVRLVRGGRRFIEKKKNKEKTRY